MKNIMKLCCPPYSEVNYALQWQIAIACVSDFMNQLTEVFINAIVSTREGVFIQLATFLFLSNPPHSAEVGSKGKG